MKALIVKENCKIYAAEVPEEPEYCRAFKGTECQGSRCNCVLDKIMYNRILTSSKESAVLCADQEKARKLLVGNHGKSALSSASLDKPKPGIYPIPDLQWEVKESWGPYHENTFPEKVAILKESTPYNQNLKEVSKDDLLEVIKTKSDQLEQEDKSRRLTANPESVFVRAGESTPPTSNKTKMIKIEIKLKSLPIGIKINVVHGGVGAGIANGETGIVCRKPEDSLTWPEYAGECKEDAVCFVDAGHRIYGLASGCQISLVDPNKLSEII